MTPRADYIIIGAGTAGCVLAKGISKRNLGTVQMVEAGGYPTSPHLHVPVEYPLAFAGRHAWQYLSEPQPQLANRRIPMPAGKTLGGSSAINALIYLRGHPKDFDRWSNSTSQLWGNEAVRGAYQSIENEIELGTLGPTELHPALKAFQQILARTLGIPIQSPLIEPLPSMGPYQRLQKNGRRRSAWNLWLDPRKLAHEEPACRIHIALNTSVQRIMYSS